MQEVRYYIKNKEIKAPFNHKELSIDINFDRDSPDARLSTNKWRFVDDSAQEIYDIYQAGLTGGEGIFEGIPFDIVVSDGVSSDKFEMYLDLAQDDTQLWCFNVECDSQPKGQIEWLNGIADSFTFEYLCLKTSYLPRSKFVPIPYIINTVPNYREVFISGLSVTFITLEIQRNISELSGLSGSLANPFSAPSDLIKAIFLILYIITMLIALVKLISDILDLIIQPVKYHMGAYIKTQIEAACAYLGLTFKSTIFDDPRWSKLFILPRKLDNPVSSLDNRILGFISPQPSSQNGYFEGTFGDLLRAMKVFFKGKVLVSNGVLTFEREDKVTSGATYIIPDILNETFGTNASELNSNYTIEFAYDINDKNTVNEYKGTTVQVITTPKFITNKDMVLIKNISQNQIPFALAKRKETLTGPEKIVKAFLDIASGLVNGLVAVANFIIKGINAITKAINSLKKVLKLIGINIKLSIPAVKPIPKIDFGKIINDRIGMLLLENDVVSTPRIFLVTESSTPRQTDISTDNKTLVNAKYLWDNFHYIDSFVPSAYKPDANQWIRKRVENVPFCYEDFLLVKNGNKIIDPNGVIVKIESLNWNIWNQTASIEYRINKLYTNNLKIDISESQGY